MKTFIPSDSITPSETFTEFDYNEEYIYILSALGNYYKLVHLYDKFSFIRVSNSYACYSTPTNSVKELFLHAGGRNNTHDNQIYCFVRFGEYITWICDKLSYQMR